MNLKRSLKPFDFVAIADSLNGRDSWLIALKDTPVAITVTIIRNSEDSKR